MEKINCRSSKEQMLRSFDKEIKILFRQCEFLRNETFQLRIQTSRLESDNRILMKEIENVQARLVTLMKVYQDCLAFINNGENDPLLFDHRSNAAALHASNPPEGSEERFHTYFLEECNGAYIKDEFFNEKMGLLDKEENIFTFYE